MLDLAWVMVQAGLAREESRGAHSRPYDFPDRDDERFLQALAHPLEGRRAGARHEGGPHDEVAARSEELLIVAMQVALKIWRYDPTAGKALREYEVSAPEEATSSTSSTSSRTRSTARSRTGRAAG